MPYLEYLGIIYTKLSYFSAWQVNRQFDSGEIVHLQSIRREIPDWSYERAAIGATSDLPGLQRRHQQLWDVEFFWFELMLTKMTQKWIWTDAKQQKWLKNGNLIQNRTLSFDQWTIAFYWLTAGFANHAEKSQPGESSWQIRTGLSRPQGRFLGSIFCSEFMMFTFIFSIMEKNHKSL